MIRIATIEDAEQLYALNEDFNGKGTTTLEQVKQSILTNEQEIIIVAEENQILVGFVCVQLKKSFCYDDYIPEMTEVFVDSNFRRRNVASSMITFAEKYCKANYPLHKFELLTGKTNAGAQALYNNLGYADDGEVHLTKRMN